MRVPCVVSEEAYSQVNKSFFFRTPLVFNEGGITQDRVMHDI